jgi:DNA-binding response OmpR family regulator
MEPHAESHKLPRVLFAEDNPDTARLIEAALRNFCALEVATTGREARARYYGAQAVADPYDLLVLDVVLPLESGLSVLEEIRAGGDAETRVVLVTGLPPEEIEENARRWGALAVWYKPGVYTDLKGRVAAALSRRVSDPAASQDAEEDNS